MPRVKERQRELAKIRRLPLAPRLNRLLEEAAAATGIDEVHVVSGGQEKAPSKKRTGSSRHDDGNAADLDLRVKGRILNFEVPADRVKVAAFVTACAARGATGIGAHPDYMGPTRLHIGFGKRAVWGAGGKAAGAPQWLRDAVAKGAPVDARP